MSAENEVRKASEKFYAALNRMVNGDADPLVDIWSHSEAVTTMHPIGGREIGWDAVRESFEEVARLSSDGSVELRNQFIQAAGDVAYEVGNEHGRLKIAGQQVAIEHRVTNIYRCEAGLWKIVHHHTDVSPAMLGVISRVKAET